MAFESSFLLQACQSVCVLKACVCLHKVLHIGFFEWTHFGGKKRNIPVAFSGQKRLFVKRVGTGEKGGNPKELMKYSALRVKKLWQTIGAGPAGR